MSNKTFRLAEHYTHIQHFITDDGEDINKLYKKHGECITECLFLSHLAESLESRSCHESLSAIADELIEFELAKFQPPELIPIYNGPKLFKGEIVYFSYNALVAKITSYQFPTWQEKWTPLVGHISSFLKWLTQLMLRIFAYRSRPHQE